jgi:hypothetical protein
MAADDFEERIKQRRASLAIDAAAKFPNDTASQSHYIDQLIFILFGAEFEARKSKQPASRPTIAASAPERRKPGRPGGKTKKIAEQMRKMDRDALAGMKQVEMEATFKASRDTCEKAREMALSINVVK